MSAPAFIDLTLPDGRILTLPTGTTVGEVAGQIGKKLARDAIGAELAGGVLVDVHTPLRASTTLKILTVGSEAGLGILRHSAAHLLASAVVRVFPGTQVTIGPATDTGFFYDFAKEGGFTPEDLHKIEATMAEIAARKEPFERSEMTREAARKLFADMGETYKLELIDAIADGEIISLYRHGDWVDLCRGPHVPHTGLLRAFRLTHVSGAYWRGDEKRPMLARIYGTAFWDQAALDAHFAAIEEAKRRDHRKLGKELDLFSFQAEAPAMPFFHAKGARVLRLLSDFVRQYYEALGFDEVITPQLVDTSLFARSGHLDNYRDNMFFAEVDGRTFGLKPMNCPGHTLIFADKLRSYRDLPIRMADFGRLHRYERSGATAGLTRVRSFCQDDAHIFCREDQVGDEIGAQLLMVQEILAHFGFVMRVRLSTRPEQSLGREAGLTDHERADWDALWTRAEESLAKALDDSGIVYDRHEGDGAFYGPKIDCEVQDALHRWHQLSTIQLDFALPRRFCLRYIGEDSTHHQPVMVHRAVLGSLERFFGILLEHTGGDLPLWLAPVQMVCTGVTDSLHSYVQQVAAAFRARGVRLRVDLRSDKLGAKIRSAELERIPIVAVVGAKEEASGEVTLRWRKKGQMSALPLDQAISAVLDAASVPGPSATLLARQARQSGPVPT